MGWDISYKPVDMTAVEYVMTHFRHDHLPADQRPQVIDTATGPNCVGLVVRYPKAYVENSDDILKHYVPENDGSVVSAVIIATRVEKGRFNFAMKWMDETAHPYYYPAKKILKNLSKLTEHATYAKEWRENVIHNVEVNKKLRSIKTAKIIRFDEPLYVGGIAETVFTATTYYSKGKQKTCYMAQNSNRLVRIPASTLRKAHIVA